MRLKKISVVSPKRQSHKSGKNSFEQLLGISTLVFLCLVIPWWCINIRENSERWDRDYQKQMQHEKAEVMRREGFQGSDYELARQADAIKAFNEQQKEHEEQRRKVLGN